MQSRFGQLVSLLEDFRLLFWPRVDFEYDRESQDNSDTPGSSIEQQNKTVRKSIFETLYAHATELDSKIMLINELVALGDRRDLAFLHAIAKDLREPSLVKHVLDGIAILEATNTVNEGSVTKKDPRKPMTKVQPQFAPPNLEVSNDSKEDAKLPLEFCFLFNDCEYDPKNGRKTGFDFQLADEFFLDIKRNMFNLDVPANRDG